MIAHQYRKIVYECDSCDETLETDTRDFDDARAMFRQEGWRAQRPVGNEWVHKCPECVEKNS
jgi:hypothetical protein